MKLLRRRMGVHAEYRAGLPALPFPIGEAIHKSKKWGIENLVTPPPLAVAGEDDMGTGDRESVFRHPGIVDHAAVRLHDHRIMEADDIGFALRGQIDQIGEM